MRKLCTINNSAKSRPIDIDIIPDWNQFIHIKNYFIIHNRRVEWRVKPNLDTKNFNLLIHQSYRMNINCTNHKRKFVVSILHNLLNASTNCSISYQVVWNIIYQPNHNNKQRSYTNKIYNVYIPIVPGRAPSIPWISTKMNRYSSNNRKLPNSASNCYSSNITNHSILLPKNLLLKLCNFEYRTKIKPKTSQKQNN